MLIHQVAEPNFFDWYLEGEFVQSPAHVGLRVIRKFIMILKLLKDKKGVVMVEYGFVVVGVVLIGVGVASVFGHKTSDLYAVMVTILFGVYGDDNVLIASGKLIETVCTGANGTIAGIGFIVIDYFVIFGNLGNSCLGDNFGMDSIIDFVVEVE